MKRIQDKSLSQTKRRKTVAFDPNDSFDYDTHLSSNTQKPKITTSLDDVPPFKICWAKVYSFPYWPSKVFELLIILVFTYRAR